MFEINLMNGKEFFKSYSYHFVPSIGDKLSIDERRVFIVEERILPISSSNRVVLFGRIIND